MRTSSQTSRNGHISRWAVCVMLWTTLCVGVSEAQIAARNDKVIFELTQPIDNPKNFNWLFTGVRREHGAHQAMYEPLFLFNYKTGALESWLATSITPNKDQDVWTLKLRDDVKWSDSKAGALQPFNAEDVEFTANLILNEGFAPTAYEAVAFRAQVKPDGVKRIDASTVEFTLLRPNPRFALETFGATMFSSLLILPKHIWQNNDPKTYTFYNTDPKMPPAPIGTGPYVLKEIDGKHALWVRNDNWWGAAEIPDPDHPGKKKPVFRPLPAPQALEWDVVDNINDSKTKLGNSDLDTGRPYSLDDLNKVKVTNPKIVGWDSSAPAWNDPCARQLDIYTPAKKLDGSANVWSDANLRKALSLLIDRTALAHDGYRDATVPSTTMFAQYPPMQPFIDEVVKRNYGLPLRPDLAKADKTLTDNGYTKDAADHYYKKSDGAMLGAVLKVDASNAPDVYAANALSAQLNGAGIKIDVKTIPHDTFWGNTIPKGDYDIVYSWLSCGSVAEPFTSMNRYSSRDKPDQQFRAVAFRNTGRWETTAATSYSNEVMELGKKPLGDPGIPALVAHAYKYLDDETPFIPLVQSPTIVPFNTKYWTGWPAKGGDTVPMTGWEGTVRMIHELKRAGPAPP
jgi:peptide/nickel transport system substrate-binding protein